MLDNGESREDTDMSALTEIPRQPLTDAQRTRAARFDDASMQWRPGRGQARTGGYYGGKVHRAEQAAARILASAPESLITQIPDGAEDLPEWAAMLDAAEREGW